MSTDKHKLSADRPCEDPAEDKLGYASFAENLARCLIKMAPSDGFVVALFGPWGSGKSTVLNFVRHYLEYDQESKPLVLQFNPWWFSGQDDLAFTFFEQLQTTLGQRSEDGDKLKSQLTRLAHVLAPLPVMGKFAEATERGLTNAENVVNLKGEIADTLAESEQRVFIFIDDIDRLTAEEIRQVFRLIKAVADFPGVTYVIALDKDVAIKALDATQNIPGEDYLEKIIQVPYDLPLPDPSSLHRLLGSQLDTLLEGTDEALFDKTHWNKVFFKGIAGLIRTPRDVIRYINALRVTYPAVQNEVNPVDFIGIEALRVFCPSVYETVRRNLDMFTGDVSQYSRPSESELKTFHSIWPETVQNDLRQPIRDLIQELFPKLQSVWGNIHYGFYWLRVKAQLRICSPEVSDVYFQFAVPGGRVSNAEMLDTIACAANRDVIVSRLMSLLQTKRLDGTSRARGFLERLQEFMVDRIPIDYVPNLIFALCSLGDTLTDWNDHPLGVAQISNESYILWTVVQLLQCLSESSMCQTLMEVVENGNSIAFSITLIERLRREHGEEDNGSAISKDAVTIGLEHFPRLDSTLLGRIRNAAAQGILLEINPLLPVLYWWASHGDQGEVKAWLEYVTETDDGLVSVLEACLSWGIIESPGGVRRYDRLDPERLAPFLDLEIVAERLEESLACIHLTERQETAVAQFKKEYRMRKDGLDPNSDPDILASYPDA